MSRLAERNTTDEDEFIPNTRALHLARDASPAEAAAANRVKDSQLSALPLAKLTSLNAE